MIPSLYPGSYSTTLKGRICFKPIKLFIASKNLFLEADNLINENSSFHFNNELSGVVPAVIIRAFPSMINTSFENT